MEWLMAEPTQEIPDRVPNPKAQEPSLASDSEQRIEEDLLDLRENLQRDHRETRQINFILIGTYLLILALLLAGSWAIWQHTHHF